jgi:hypothetical protein
MINRTSKLVMHVLLAFMLFAGFSSAAAAPATDHQVVTESVSFTLTASIPRLARAHACWRAYGRCSKACK